MSGDFSRKTFNQKKHYNGVLMQQGRVQLDADWNEQLDIQQHRTFTETIDVVGPSGVPRHNDGFLISTSVDGSELLISQGRIYVGGLMCELGSSTDYFNQPYFPNPDTNYFVPASPPYSPPASPINQAFQDIRNLMDGTYLVYLDAWIRDITYLDDPHIHEVALGDADTAIRTQTVWQVKLKKVSTGFPTTISCTTPFTEWEKEIAPTTGKMNAQTVKSPSQTNPCVLPPGSGYRSLENQLYRVEVQKGGDRSTATFKWSRDNASIETKILGIVNYEITVENVGKDEVLGFAGGQWVEIVDEEATLKGTPNELVQIDAVTPDAISGAFKITAKALVGQYDGKSGLKLRRWDQSSDTPLPQGISMAGGWIDLEDGVQVKFSNGTYHAGDYWLIPARTATGEIEWPTFDLPGNFPMEQSPLGIKHHYCCLALLNAQKQNITLSDCRKLFPSLTEINSLVQQLDAQERLSRTCLVGFGIVCGLTVQNSGSITAGIANYLTITKGYGITSEGYLINQPNDIFYDRCRVFNPIKKKYYDRFVDKYSNKQKFPIWELVEVEAVGNNNDILFAKNPSFLVDKVVVLFVELTDLTGNNYNPKSCAEFGMTTAISIKPLLIEKANLKALGQNDGSIFLNFAALRQLRLPRFSVDGQDINTVQDIFEAYYSILSKDFLANVFNALNAAFDTYHGLIGDIYPFNPFPNLYDNYLILIDTPEKVSFNIQYYYDFFSDVELTYNEISKLGFGIDKSGCLPKNPFPRHLVLGNATVGQDDLLNNNRSYFVVSPLLDKQYDKVQELRFLFRRLVQMVQNVNIVKQQDNGVSRGTVFTPSKLGDFSLSQKAMPFYYAVDNNAASLQHFWSYEKSKQGISDENLCYNSYIYSKKDFVLQPLAYDLEPNNFLRIEGAIGNQYKSVASSITKQINNFRLPIKVVALQTGNAISNTVENITTGSLGSFLAQHPGIQHKAGVTMGGTFILVYKGVFDRTEVNIAAGTIIADFYLPYICCSTQAVRTVFTIQPNRFLFDDASNYPFTISPAPSSVNDIGNDSKLDIFIDENNQLQLHPAIDITKTLPAALTYNDVELDVTIVKPDASFTATIHRGIELTGAPLITVQLAAANTDANGYEWIVDKKVSTLFQTTATPAAINFNALLQLNRNPVIIELEITYNINDHISTDMAMVTFSFEAVNAIPLNQSLILTSKPE